MMLFSKLSQQNVIGITASKMLNIMSKTVFTGNSLTVAKSGGQAENKCVHKVAKV